MDLILNAVNGLSNAGQEATSAEVSFLNDRIRSLELRLEAQNNRLEAQSNKLETQTNIIMELKSVVGKLEGILMSQGFNVSSQGTGFQGGLRSNISSQGMTESLGLG
jgi:TolA-binding protein